MKVIGVRKAASNYIHCPKGFHVEIWCNLNKEGDIEVWTSELLTCNSWTTGVQGKRIDTTNTFRRPWAYGSNDNVPLTKRIKEAAIELWETETPKTVVELSYLCSGSSRVDATIYHDGELIGSITADKIYHDRVGTTDIYIFADIKDDHICETFCVYDPVFIDYRKHKDKVFSEREVE
jgi:hypothetical protein